MRGDLNRKAPIFSLGFLLCLPSLAFAQNAPTVEDRSFEIVWEQNLGARYDGAFYRWAICADGRSYFTDALGRVAVLDPQGRVLYDRAAHSELQGTVAIACDSAGRLRAANPGSLLTWEFSETLRLVSSIDLKSRQLQPSRLAILPSGEAVVLGSRTGVEHVLHVLTKEGELAQSFGHPTDERTPSMTRQVARRGSIVWDSSNNRLLYSPLNPLDVRAYDLDGRLLARNLDASPDLQPTSKDPLLQAVFPSDEIAYAAGLPDKTVAVQMIVLGERGGQKRARATLLVLLDAQSLRVTRLVPLRNQVPGILQGASADGILYFAAVSPQQGIRLIAARSRRSILP
jgi:hypothetical protein